MFKWFLRKKCIKEPNYCIECTNYYPDLRMANTALGCRYAKCAETIENKVNSILLVCPEYNISEALWEEMGFCTIKRSNEGAHCKDFVAKKE